jgi:hypothetical protein
MIFPSAAISKINMKHDGAKGKLKFQGQKHNMLGIGCYHKMRKIRLQEGGFTGNAED